MQEALCSHRCIGIPCLHRRVPTVARRLLSSESSCQPSCSSQPSARIPAQLGRGSCFSGAQPATSLPRHRRQRIAVSPRAAGADAMPSAASGKGPPVILWRVAAALMYLIPWIDSLSIGREIYRAFPTSILLYFLPGPMVRIYYSSQFAPLIVFFLLFLAVVKNTKIPHFVRFNCMQSIMIDIIVMLFTIVRSYFPSELRWTPIFTTFDSFAYIFCMFPVLYCVYFSLTGKYADIPLVSESVYMQVEQSEHM